MEEAQHDVTADISALIAQWDDLIRTKQWEAARQCGVQMRYDYPRDPRVLNNWAVVSMHDGRWDDAQAAWAEALTIQPHYLYALVGLAHCAVQKKAWNEAYQWGHQALEVDPDFPEARRLIIAVLGHLGRMHVQTADWRRVAEIAQELLQYQPDSPMAYYFLGCVELGQDTPAVRAEYQFRQGIACLDLASVAADNQVQHQLLWALGDSLYRQQRFAEALTIFRQLKEVRPDDVTVQNGERNALTQLVKQAVTQRALEAMKTGSDDLLRIAVDSEVGWNARGLYFLDHMHQPQEAIRCFQQALEHATSPADKATCATNLGWAFMRQHRVWRADHYFRAAAQWAPQSQAVQMALRVRRMQKQYDRLLAMVFVAIVLVIIFH